MSQVLSNLVCRYVVGCACVYHLIRALKSSFALRLITLCYASRLRYNEGSIGNTLVYHAILGNCDSHCHLVSTRAQFSIQLAKKGKKEEQGLPIRCAANHKSSYSSFFGFFLHLGSLQQGQQLFDISPRIDADPLRQPAHTFSTPRSSLV